MCRLRRPRKSEIETTDYEPFERETDREVGTFLARSLNDRGLKGFARRGISKLLDYCPGNTPKKCQKGRDGTVMFWVSVEES